MMILNLSILKGESSKSPKSWTFEIQMLKIMFDHYYYINSKTYSPKSAKHYYSKTCVKQLL